MRAQELLIDNTANNLANVNTNGFKRQHVDFADLTYSESQSAGSDVGSGQIKPTGTQIGSGVRVLGTSKVFSQGVVEDTGQATDVAIQGSGFFKVTLPGGDERFTRDGGFRIDGNGILVNGDGFIVDGNITVPDGVALESINISAFGEVSAVVDGTSQNLGTIPIYRFINPVGLKNEGGNLYSETPASGASTAGTPGQDVGFLRQRFIERSNVEVVRELVSLITAQRAYEINSRAIQAGDEMLSNTAQIVR